MSSLNSITTYLQMFWPIKVLVSYSHSKRIFFFLWPQYSMMIAFLLGI